MLLRRGASHPYTRPVTSIAADDAARTVSAESKADGFGRLIAELAAGLIVSAGEALDSGIEQALERIVGFYGADRSTVFRIVSPPSVEPSDPALRSGDMVATDSWAVEGVARIEGVFGSRSFPWALDRVLRGESIELDAMARRPAEAVVDLASCEILRIRRVIATPLISAGQVVGALAIGQVRDREPWSAIERAQLSTVAGLFASAVARRRGHQELVEAHRHLEAAQGRFRHAAATALQAQEEERRRVARELHDDVVQRLVSLSLSLELSGAVAGIAGEARAIAETVHGLSRSLHPRLVESLGLAGAIEAETASFAERFPGRARLRLAGEGETVGDRGVHAIAPEVAAVAYRILQEALRNVLKHAEAGEVSVECSLEGGRLQLRIEDDGCGFASNHEGAGLGLVSIRERAALVGGVATFERSSLGGVAVVASLPVIPAKPKERGR